MTKISFIFKDYRRSSFEYKDCKSYSIREAISHYNRWIDNPYDTKINEYTSIQIKVYAHDKLIDNLDQTFFDLVSADKTLLDEPRSKYGYFCRKDYILVTMKRLITIVKDLSIDEMDNSIVNFLDANDIKRACWMVEGNPLDINNSFNHYNSSDKYVGYDHHKLNCNINKCDLITCSSSYDGMRCIMTDRSKVFNSMFLIDGKIDPSTNNFFDLIQLPLLCNKQTIIKKFLEDVALYCEHGDDTFYKSLKANEIDVYFVPRIAPETIEDPAVEHIISRITDNDNYILDFLKENENGIDDTCEHYDKKYVFVLKSFRLNDLNAILINTLPVVDLLNIIYDYVDFESIEPNPAVFDNH